MKTGWIVYWSLLIGGIVLGVLLWAPPGAIEAFGKVLGALSPMVTVGLAIFGLFIWRVQLVAKRRFELAEEALVATYAVVYALEAIRSPFSWSTEGSTRKQGENETPEQKEKLDHAFVPWERMNAQADRFSALAKTSLLMEAHFDKIVSANMRELLGARGRIGSAANMIRKLEGMQPLQPGTQKTYDKCHAVLYASGTRDPDSPGYDDVLSEKIGKARDGIVAHLKPYLSEPTLGTLLSPRREPLSTPPA